SNILGLFTLCCLCQICTMSTAINCWLTNSQVGKPSVTQTDLGWWPLGLNLGPLELNAQASTVNADSLEEDSYQPSEMDDSGLFRGSRKHFNDLTKVVDLSKMEGEKTVSKVSSLIRQREVDEGVSNGSETPLGDFQEQPKDISKRLGGFLKGKYSYRQVLEPTMQGVQKRYGGFIGVRKSARKWNNQKRFSEFLKQYLGMSPRSSEYDTQVERLHCN
uniref:Prepronociceptin n=1 Tax=Gopherus evgoodei TaxID=1825980 RepID=A0A8C4XZ17_9SAUR